ncbi:MAG: hypothetical protein ACI89J_003575 [Hyphomicrobiaceae bacterium]|jgi:hypothetical protein
MSGHRALRKTAVVFCLVGGLGMAAVEARKQSNKLVSQRLSAIQDFRSVMRDVVAVSGGKSVFQPRSFREAGVPLRQHVTKKMADLFPPDHTKSVWQSLPDFWQIFAGPAPAWNSSSRSSEIEADHECLSCRKETK